MKSLGWFCLMKLCDQEEECMDITEVQEFVAHTPADARFSDILRALNTVGDAIEDGYRLCRIEDAVKEIESRGNLEAGDVVEIIRKCCK